MRTPGGGKPPHPRLPGSSNKENVALLKGTPVSGALLTPGTPQRNFSIASVASTYSEFVVIYTFVPNLFFFASFFPISVIEVTHVS